jgi:hypothetical protein
MKLSAVSYQQSAFRGLQRRPRVPCHSERSEESRSAFERIEEQRIRARFLATLGMTRFREVAES